MFILNWKRSNLEQANENEFMTRRKADDKRFFRGFFSSLLPIVFRFKAIKMILRCAWRVEHNLIWRSLFFSFVLFIVIVLLFSQFLIYIFTLILMGYFLLFLVADSLKIAGFVSWWIVVDDAFNAAANVMCTPNKNTFTSEKFSS